MVVTLKPQLDDEVFNAPIDLILTPHDVVQPDLVVAAGGQVSARGIEGEGDWR